MIRCISLCIYIAYDCSFPGSGIWLWSSVSGDWRPDREIIYWLLIDHCGWFLVDTSRVLGIFPSDFIDWWLMIVDCWLILHFFGDKWRFLWRVKTSSKIGSAGPSNDRFFLLFFFFSSSCHTPCHTDTTKKNMDKTLDTIQSILFYSLGVGISTAILIFAFYLKHQYQARERLRRTRNLLERSDSAVEQSRQRRELSNQTLNHSYIGLIEQKLMTWVSIFVLMWMRFNILMRNT